MTANGFGSRNRARVAPKKSQLNLEADHNHLALSRVVQSDDEIVDAKPLAIAGLAGSKKSNFRLVTSRHLLLYYYHC